MNVFTVTASIRMSRQIDSGTWATVELGAEATAQANTSWTDSQAQLYQALRHQLSTLWQEKAHPAPQLNGHHVDTSTGEILTCPVHPTRTPRPANRGGGIHCTAIIGEDDEGKTIYCKWTTKPQGGK